MDEVVVTNETIEFYNLTSAESNFTNTNDTYNARADFYELEVGLRVRNINTSTDLFTSTSGSQNHNATFAPGQVIRIVRVETLQQGICDNFIPGIISFFGLVPTIFIMLAILLTTAIAIVVLLIIRERSVGIDLSGETIIAVFTSIFVLGLIGLVAIIIFTTLCVV